MKTAARTNRKLSSRWADRLPFVWIGAQFVIAAPFIYLTETGRLGMRTLSWLLPGVVLTTYVIGVVLWRRRSPPPPLPRANDLDAAEIHQVRQARLAAARRDGWEPYARSFWVRNRDLLGWGTLITGVGILCVLAGSRMLEHGRIEPSLLSLGASVVAGGALLAVVGRRRATRRRQLDDAMNHLAVALGGSSGRGFPDVARWLAAHWPFVSRGNDLFAGRLHHYAVGTAGGRPVLVDAELEGVSGDEHTDDLPGRVLIYVAAPGDLHDAPGPVREHAIDEDFTVQVIPAVGLLARASGAAVRRFKKNPSKLTGLAALAARLAKAETR